MAPRPSHTRFISDDDDGDPLAEDDVELVTYHKVHGAEKGSRQQVREFPGQNIPLGDIAKRFRSSMPHGTSRQGIVIDGVDRKRARVDHDIDELSLDTDDKTTKTRTSHAVPKSSSLSTKGDVERTRFTGAGSGTKPHHRDQEAHPLMDSLQRTREIIGQGLGVRRAVDGQFGYSSEADGSCLLYPLEISSILHPTDNQGRILNKYGYLTINLRKVHDIILPDNEGCVISIRRSVEPQNSAGAKILVELCSPQEVEKFYRWVKALRDDIQVKVDRIPA